MSDSRTCPRCDAALPADAPDGLCPHCLLKMGFESQAGPATEALERTAAYRPSALRPTVEQLAARFPQLEVLECIGQGGMGVVYKARQIELDRTVALKILRPDIDSDPSFAERFVREARALAKLNHPAIVAVYDFGRVDGFYYFLMEYVDGANLRELERSGQLEPQQALALVPQICEALQYAHDQGVVHRDIKPENILVDKQGRVKIADFGLAKMVGAAPDAHTLTGAWQVMGTPHYMAPEQMQGAHAVDHRADIYSMGVVIYEMLTGELPIGRFPLPSQKASIDDRLDEVVLRALEREPQRRYQHASEVKTEFESLRSQAAAPPAPTMYGHEYRSRAALFGVPLVHIAFGWDPVTGRPRTAQGIIAIGDRAIGGLAIGGGAVGIVSIGGAAVGLLSLGGLSIGLLAACGGLAIGGFAFGGGALGVVAIGGATAGYYAFGGAAWGQYVLTGAGSDPEAVRFFGSWASNWLRWLTWLGIGMPFLGGLLAVLIWLVFYWQSRARSRIAEASGDDGAVKPADASSGDLAFGRDVLILILGTIGMFDLRYSLDDAHVWAALFPLAGVVMIGALHAVRRMAPTSACVTIAGGMAIFVALMPSAESILVELQGAASAGDMLWVRVALGVLAGWLLLELAVIAWRASGPERFVRLTDGWRCQPRLAHQAAHALLAVVYAMALLMFFSFSGSRTPSEHVFELGQPGPWLVLRQIAGQHEWSLRLSSSSVLIALVGYAALTFERLLTRLEHGREHPFQIHVAIWGLLLAGTTGLGLLSTSLHAWRGDDTGAGLFSGSALFLATLVLVGLAIAIGAGADWLRVRRARAQAATASTT